MLSDIERKVLRVISNYLAGRHRAPTINKLRIKAWEEAGAGLLSFWRRLTDDPAGVLNELPWPMFTMLDRVTEKATT